MSDKKLIYLKKIDAVLAFLAKTKYQKGQSYADNILLKMGLDSLLYKTHKPDISDIEMQAILNKLKKDEYVHSEIVGISVPRENGMFSDIVDKECYYISFEGFIFNEQGGYKLQDIRHRDENNRVEKLEKNQSKNQSAMTWLTVFVALGTLVAAWYYLNELNKQYHWF